MVIGNLCDDDKTIYTITSLKHYLSNIDSWTQESFDVYISQKGGGQKAHHQSHSY